MAAAARERRNTPRHLVFLAGLMVVGAAVACGTEARGWTHATRAARDAMGRQAQVGAQLAEYTELKAKAGGSDKEHVGFDKMVSTAETLAASAGLATPAHPLDTSEPRGNLVLRSWRYSK